MPCLKDNPHNLTKHESKRISKIPKIKLFSEFGDIWNTKLILKNPNFQSLCELGKTW